MTSTTNCQVTAHQRIVALREAEGRCPGCGQTHPDARPVTASDFHSMWRAVNAAGLGLIRDASDPADRRSGYLTLHAPAQHVEAVAVLLAEAGVNVWQAERFVIRVAL